MFSHTSRSSISLGQFRRRLMARLAKYALNESSNGRRATTQHRPDSDLTHDDDLDSKVSGPAIPATSLPESPSSLPAINSGLTLDASLSGIESTSAKVPEPAFSIPPISSTECSICKEDLDKSLEFPVILKCGHVFGNRCITIWIEQQKGGRKCPECREDPYIKAPGADAIANHVVQEPVPPRLGLDLPFKICWSWPQVNPEVWDIRLRSFTSSDLHAVLEAFATTMIAREPPSRAATLFRLSYIHPMTGLWEYLENCLVYSGRALAAPTERNAYPDLLLALPACRSRCLSPARISISRVTTFVRAAIVQSQAFNADFGMRLCLGQWLTQPVSTFAEANPSGLDWTIEHILKLIFGEERRRLDSMYADLEKGALRTRADDIPDPVEYLHVVEEAPFFVDENLNLVATGIE